MPSLKISTPSYFVHFQNRPTKLSLYSTPKSPPLPGRDERSISLSVSMMLYEPLLIGRPRQRSQQCKNLCALYNEQERTFKTTKTCLVAMAVMLF